MRSQEDIPNQGQVVIVQSTESAYDGSAGYVTQKTKSQSARPFTVKFNDGKSRTFRTGDLVLAE